MFHRPRPEVVPHLMQAYYSSFPSGHSVMAPVVYLTLAALLAAGDRRLAIKVVLLATASLLENWIDETERRTWFLFETVQEL